MFAGLLVGCAFHSGPALPAGLSHGGFVPCCWELCLHWGSPCLPILCFCCPWQVYSSLICVSLLCNPCWWMRSSAGQSWSCPDQFQTSVALSLLRVWHLNLQKVDTLKMSLVMRCWLKASVVDAAKRPKRGLSWESTALLFKSVLCLVKRSFLTYTVAPVECWCSQSQVYRAEQEKEA